MSGGQTNLQLILEIKNRIQAGLSSARKTLNENVNSMKLKIAELKGSMEDSLSGVSKQIPQLGSLMKFISQPIVGIAAGIMLVGSAYAKAVGMASDWQSSMNKVNVTAQISKKELESLSEKIMEIGKRSTGDLMGVPETFNKIISAGLDVNTSLATLEPTLKAAKAGFTDAGVAADAVTNIMGSTGIKDATKIYDVLFATLNKGKAEFSDIANYLPKIIPGARQVGVSLQTNGICDRLHRPMQDEFVPLHLGKSYTTR